MAIVVLAPAMPVWTWLAMVALTVVAAWVCREELRELAVARPVAAKAICGVVVGIAGAAGVQAYDMSVMCNWNTIMDFCDSSAVCAWAVYIGNNCYW